MPRKDKNMLTGAQLETLKVLKSYFQDNDFSPTIADLSKKLNLKSQTVIDRLAGLRKKGFIRRANGKWRNIELVDKGVPDATMIDIPVLGLVGADNMAVFATEEFNRFLHIDERLLEGNRDVFAVRAMGDSMRDAGIDDGDYVFVERAVSDDMLTGDTVVAIVDDKAVVKSVEKKGKSIVLRSQNNSKAYDPIVPKELENFQIVGRVVKVLPFSEPDDWEFEFINENR
ncbi:MAG: transcriptional repressor LexA [Patescibacteria group bacterium]|nr:transcriptional repressor LexA [Patescibacteria group bacterium]